MPLGIESGPGLPHKVWIKHLDVFLATGKLNPDVIPYLDEKQWYCINEIKKSFKRTTAKS